jgi:hypothetical protein
MIDVYFLFGLALLFFLLGIFSDKGKVLFFGLSMALFFASAGIFASPTTTVIIENAENSYATTVKLPSMKGLYYLSFGLGFISFLFLVFTCLDLIGQMLRG